MSSDTTADEPDIIVKFEPSASFTLRGFPHADDFYQVLQTKLPPLLRHRVILGLCYGAAIEHIEAAREALEPMYEIEIQPVPVVRRDVVMPNGQSYPGAESGDMGELFRRYMRAFRFAIMESRASLEALIYELAFAFRIVSTRPDGTDNDVAIGFLYDSIRRAFVRKESVTGSQSLRLLRKLLEDIAVDPRYKDLDDMRRFSFHRRLDIVSFSVMTPIIDTETWTILPTTPPPRFLRPDRVEDLIGSFEEEIVPTIFLSDTLVWLTGIVNESYRLAALALQEV